MKFRHRFLPGRMGLVLLYLSSQLPVMAEPDDEIIWKEGRYFDVIGTDNRSVSYANALAEHIAETCRRYLKAGSHGFAQKMLITLRPEHDPEFKGADYRIQVSPRGQVSLDFCWDESLDFETACYATTEAYLLNYARFNHGADAARNVRFWALSALASQSYLSLRPALRANFIEKARRSELPEIGIFLSLRLPEATEKDLNSAWGYLLFQILRDNRLSRSQLAILLDRAVAGVDVEADIAKILFPGKPEESKERLAQWWQSQIDGYLAREYEFCESLTTSRLWIEKMADFDVVRVSGEKLQDLMGLWDGRHDENLRSLLGARCEIIRLRMERVNPAYFNAALSLGTLYEAVLEAKRRHEFIRAVAVYLNDWEDAKRLHARVDELTSNCD